eukprot:6506694-Alexandrium_andersonii.AAC.1
MSASLVGSEMCIRDRPLLAGHALLLVFGGAKGPGWGRAWRGDRSLLWVCLLYTSDAADDM